MNLGNVPPPPQGGLWDGIGAGGLSASGAPMTASVQTAIDKSYVDDTTSTISELENRVEKLEKLVDKLLIEFMPEYKV